MTTLALLHRDAEVGRRLGQTLAAALGITVIGVAQGLPGLRELFTEAVPQLLVVDLMLPPAHVKALLHDLRRHAPGGPLVLVLAVAADDPRVMEALRDGADGYYAQADSPVSLASAVEQLLRGESSMTPQIARQLKSHFDAARLCDTDQRLLQWTAEGFLIGEVARALQMSVHGAGVRIRDLYRALQDDLRPALSAV
ncbi:MAG TPA: hypothetical protein VF169_09450 [Albitalea sp.]|uniref:hypothetical protein n=1 Tax=Piscinibacter sp. TaxID=1903157 RepID=UPI002ED35EA9